MLEFNPPAHGTWNIVHIGMLVPESHQIYVCAVNCMRGVVLTAAEMNASDRFSFVILKEEDIIRGTVEDITLQGTIDVINKLPKRPPVVCLFTVCTHHFLGCSYKHIYDSLSRAFPDIDFIHGFMDPIMRKEGMSPDQKLRLNMYRVLEPLPEETGKLSLIGSNVCIGESSDLYKVAELCGYNVTQMPELSTYTEYKKMGSSSCFAAVVPNGKKAVESTASRLGREGLYMPLSFSYDECREQNRELFKTLGKLSDSKNIDSENLSGKTYTDDELLTKLEQYETDQIRRCEENYSNLKSLIGDAPIVIDHTAHPRPLGMARFLLDHGFNVREIYVNAVSSEESADQQWFRENAPQVKFEMPIEPAMRVKERIYRDDSGVAVKVLAIGTQAAWFTGTNNFVNMVEGGDLQGIDGIARFAGMMEDAWLHEKDAPDLIPRKGLGCESCI